MVKGNTVYSFTVTENVKRKVWLEDQDGNLVGTVETVSEVSSRSIDTPMGNADNAKLACERLRKPFSETLAATPY